MSAEIETLINRVAQQDRRAFARLYGATSAQVFGLICTVLKDPARAQKALQDTYLKIWRSADRYGASGLGAMTWVMTCARSIAVDRLQQMPDDFEGTAADLVSHIYWRGDSYDVLARQHSCTTDVMRCRVADALAQLQARLAP